jgi:hypothetical protein
VSHGYLDDSGLNRDSLANALTRLTAVEARPYVVARASGQTDGLGGLTAGAFTENCTLTVLVNAIRLTFSSPRPNTRYHVDAYHSSNQNRYAVDTARSVNAVDIQFRRDDNTQVSASTVQIDFNIIVTDKD